jgi:acyl dehydratase
MKFEKGKTYDFGITKLSEEEIIDFAKTYDPLDFHTDINTAMRSRFKGLIASGPHLFNKIYKEKWVPLFGKSVICGLEVSNWKFLKPAYANQEIKNIVTIKEVKENNEKNWAAITWLFEFKDMQNELVQTLKMKVLHHID